VWVGIFVKRCFIILAIEKKSNFSVWNFKLKNFVRNKMNNFSVRLFLCAALVCGVFFLTNCSSTTTGTNNTTAKNDAPKNTATTTTNTTTTTTETKTEPAGDSVGVAECDEYIKKYEACLTKIAKDAPQVQPSLKTAFEQQRNSFKQAAANPQSKATLASICKQAIETAKTSTAAYKCEW
jgi:hypothetical protein